MKQHKQTYPQIIESFEPTLFDEFRWQISTHLWSVIALELTRKDFLRDLLTKELNKYET